MVKNLNLKVIVIALLSVIIGLSSVFSFTSYAEEDSAKWMSQLDDSSKISEVTIPGTHDSGTQYVDLGYVMRCQNKSIAEQLDFGYRYIDLRLCIKENKDGTEELNIVHNFANCYRTKGFGAEKLEFSDVTSSIYDFLELNPTEFVVLNLKIEDDEHSISDVQNMIHSEIIDNNSYWYTENEIPTVGEARGKIVLMTRFEDEAGLNETGIQLHWDEQSNKDPVDIPYELYVTDACRLWVQDRYKYAVDDKYDAVVDGLENCEADENTIFLNFVSTAGSGYIGHPKGYAKQLNKLLLNYELQSQTSYGIIIVDFGNEELASHIYQTNF